MSNLIQLTKNIQRHLGVEADGIFGPRTAAAVWVELNSNGSEVSALADMDVIDERSLQNISTLDPAVQENFRMFTRRANATAATLGCSYVMISGDRSYKEQNALYNQPWDGKDNDGDGKIDEADEKVTNAKGGQSNHNFGIAGDFGVFRNGDYLDNDNPTLAAKVHRACSEHAVDCGLEWGGSWTSFKDMPHYEYATGLTMAEKRAKFSKEGSIV